MKHLALLLVVIQAFQLGLAKNLDDYLALPESVYNYEVMSTDTSQAGVTVHFLNLTSLTWFDETVTTTPVWWHYFTIIVPDTATYTDSCILYISGGDNTDDPPTAGSGNVGDMIQVSRNTGAVTSVLEMIPNQPLYFTEEQNGTRPRSEDAIIGYTWLLFLEETITDPEIVVLFPMVKAASQAVTAMFDYVPQVDARFHLSSVVPTGFSKRGWTTWLLGCVDSRVLAIAPVVFDLLNFVENLVHHNMALGGWSWAFTSYYTVGVPAYLHDPRTRLIEDDIDPLEYNDRLTMPKLVSAATGDQFFLLDDSNYWWTSINGDENHFVMYENDDHSVGDHRDLLWQNLEGFFISVNDGIAFPEYTFSNVVNPDQTGTITLTTTTTPDFVRVWSADTTNRTCEPDDDINGDCRKDFRLARFNVPTPTLVEWFSEDLQGSNGVYTQTYDAPEEFGFREFHIEVGYPAPGGRQFHFTSESLVLPDILPFPNCTTPEECQGELK